MRYGQHLRKMFAILVIFLIGFFCFMVMSFADEEESDEKNQPVLYVMVDNLFARMRPKKKAYPITSYDFGDVVNPTGRMSEDNMWVEITTGESDLAWCCVDFLTERLDVFHVFSLNDQSIKIRSKPGKGKVTGYAKKGQVLEITQVVMGYGRCSKGWVDLSYFIEDCE